MPRGSILIKNKGLTTKDRQVGRVSQENKKNKKKKKEEKKHDIEIENSKTKYKNWFHKTDFNEGMGYKTEKK